MKNVCPKCKSSDYIILEAKNDNNEIIISKFLCVCMHSGNTTELKKYSFLTKLKECLCFLKGGKI